MEKSLSLYKLVNGQAVSFPSVADQITVSAFTATYQRMGGAPNITATVKYPSCLDGQWKDVFVEFRGERFFVKNEPSSEKDNTDERYSHSVTFVSERQQLDEVYMIDAVQEDSDVDGYKSNDTKILFMGNIAQWAARLNDSLAYCGLYDPDTETGYHAVVDTGITSEDILVSFEDKFISEALQEGFKAFNIPYYFVGKTIHFGYVESTIATPVEYGSEKALLRVGRTNANIKLTNRCSGYGSSENIPYYYPNETPLGEVSLNVDSSATASIRSKERFGMRVGQFPISYGWRVFDVGDNVAEGLIDQYSGTEPGTVIIYVYTGGSAQLVFEDTFVLEESRLVNIDISVGNDWSIWTKFTDYDEEFYGPHLSEVSAIKAINIATGIPYAIGTGAILPAGEYKVAATVEMELTHPLRSERPVNFSVTMHYACTAGHWVNNAGNPVDTYELGLNVSGTPTIGDTIGLNVIHRLEAISRLMPPIFRSSGGVERFYNAENDTYPHPEGGYYEFENEYSDSDRRELILEFPDIKPTITGIKNASNQRIDKFLALAWDTNDNDEVDENGNYIHPYFFAKLAKTNGTYGFNLFDCATDTAMVVSFTSGVCGACKFEIGVDQDTKKNTVQVDADGNLLRDEYGDVRCGREGKPQERFLESQQDTSAGEVWVALKKDNSTYPVVMPSAKRNLKPATTDTFVILNVVLPNAYILAAEGRLKDAIIEYMASVNSPIFNPSVDFSRVFLEETPSFLESFNENALLPVKYNNRTESYYVSNFSYTMSEGDILPSISVDLISKLTTTTNSLQVKLDAVKQDVLKSVGTRDFMSQAILYFLRKDIEDTAAERITFLKGAAFGKFNSGNLGSGGAVQIDQDGNSLAEFDYLKVRKKATFAELVVDKAKAIEGDFFITPAGMVIIRVEPYTGYYRCFFQKTDNDGSIVFNPFVVGDLARCQTFNLTSNKYYWRKVVGAGQDYIDLSTEEGEYDGSDIPEIGDNVVQLGNVNDEDRQSAIALSSYGSNSPSLKMYHGINTFSLSGKDMFGVEYDPTTGYPRFYNYGAMRLGARAGEDGSFISYDNVSQEMNIKAIVNFLEGSTGIENIEAFQELSDNVDGLEYLKTALGEDTTTIAGGLILTSLIQLGYKDAQDIRHIMAGVSGLGQNAQAPAAWFGGPMVDHEANPTATDYAKSLIRFDGTGYLAKGNITWDANGYGQAGGSGNNYAVKWGADGIRLGSGVYIGSDSDKTLGSILELLNKFDSWFEEDTETHTLILKRDGNNNARNFAAYGEVTAGGVGSGGSGGGGIDRIYFGQQMYRAEEGSLAINIPLTGSTGIKGVLGITALEEAIVTAGKVDDVKVDGVSVVTNKIANISLSGYATESWVNGRGFLTSHQSVTLASGTNNGTLKLTTNAGTVDNIAVKGLAALAFKASLAFSDLTSHPTTISGYGITDAYTKTQIDAKTITVAETALKFGDSISANTIVGAATSTATFAGTAADSDKLGGLDSPRYFRKNLIYASADCNSMEDNSFTVLDRDARDITCSNRPTSASIAGGYGVLTVKHGAYRNQIFFPYTYDGTLYTRGQMYDAAAGVIWGGWNTIWHSGNLTASVIGGLGILSNNISGNAATATKLATARNIWGRSFDGTAAIDGDMLSVGRMTFTAKTSASTSGNVLEVVTLNGVTYLHTTLPFCSDSEITAGGVGQGGGGGAAVWGGIEGTLSNQTDLWSVLQGKQASLGSGSEGQILKWVSGSPTWAAAPATGVTTFNNRTGAVTLSSTDVTTALGATYVQNANYATSAGSAGSAGSADKLNRQVVSDLNDATQYRFWESTTNSPTHSPVSNWMQGITVAMNNNPNYRQQLAISSRLYLRSQDGGTWGSWGTIAFTSDIPTSLSQLSADTTHRLVTDTQITAWNAKWDYNENTIKAVKVNNAGNADTLESHSASYFATASSLGNYLPLGGGTINGGSTESPLAINSTGANSRTMLEFRHNGSRCGYFGYKTDTTPIVWINGLGEKTIYHSGNLIASVITSALGATYVQNANYATNAGQLGGLGESRYFRKNLITDSADCNTMEANSFTILNKDAGSLTCANRPTAASIAGGYGVLTIKHGAYANQIFFPYNSQGDLYTRSQTYAAGAALWGDWHTIYHSGNANNASTPWEAASLTLHGAISGATTITASGTVTGLGCQFGYIEIPTGQNVINSLAGYTLYLNYSRADNVVIASGGGNVGIGTTSPSEKLHVAGNVYSTGNYLGNGEVTAGSDARWKHNITPVFNGIDAIMRLQPSEWEWNSDNHKGSGLIAQDVQKVIPHLVKEDGEGYLHLTYDGLHAYEISAIQSHETRIERLEQENRELRQQIQRLQQHS